jgi:uncharacterized membrane protein
MSRNSTPPRSVQSNIEAIVRLEEEVEEQRRPLERVSEAVGSFAGTNCFIALQLCFVACWVGVNLGTMPGVPAFDPFPFSLLSGVLSLEGVLLAAFVLIRQNRMSLKADHRNHLDLQINLLSEKEVTKVIQMLQVISRQMGIEAEAVDREVEELSQVTAVEAVSRQVQDNV